MKPARAILAWILLCTAAPGTAGDESKVEAGESSKQFSLVIRERKLVGGEDTVRVEQGDRVELVFASDEPVRLHLHGYDIEFDVSPADQTRVTFDADATGRFPLTSHGFGNTSGHGHAALLYLEVYPD